MNYVQKYMSDHSIKTGHTFRINRFPRLRFYFDELYYLHVEGDDYVSEITDTDHILFRLLTDAYYAYPSEGPSEQYQSQI